MIVMMPPGLFPRGQSRQEKHWEHSQTSPFICSQTSSTSSRATAWAMRRGLKS